MKKATLIMLILIVGIAIGIRLPHLTAKGFCVVDSAIYLMEAKWFLSALKAIPIIFLGKGEETDRGITTILREKIEGLALYHPRPTHSFLIALFSLFTGGVKDYTGNIQAAFFGILTIIMAYLIGSSLYNQRIGLLSAFILSISPFHILYSREGLSEMSAMFFFMLAFYLYHKSTKEQREFFYLAICAFFLGIAFTCNQRWIPALSLIFIYEAFYQLRRKFMIKRWFYLFCFAALPAILWQIPYYFAMLLFKRAGQVMPFPSYFDLLFLHVRAPVEGAAKSFYFNPTFLYSIYFMEGAILCILSVIGLILMIRNLNFQNFTLSLWFLLGFALYTFIEPPILPLRSVFSYFPPIAIFAAVCIEKFFIKKHYLLLCFVICIIAINKIPKAFSLLALRSGFREAFSYIQKELPTKKVFTTSGWCSNFYMGFDDVEILRYTLTREELMEFYRKGYRYAVIDINKYFMKGPTKREPIKGFRWIEEWPCEKSELLRDITKKCRPIYVAFDNRGLYLHHWLELGGGNLSKTLNFFKNIPYHEKFGIRIYDLNDYFSMNKNKRIQE